MLKITTISDQSVQGHSEPYLCSAENGQEYFVKGLRSGRVSQINEWLCANIAEALNLPIPPFELLEICPDLFDELPAEQQRGLGCGAVFASQAVDNAVWFDGLSAQYPVNSDLQRKIFAFDWLIKNPDRTSGNSNLLFNFQDNKLHMIDHNLAFAEDFDAQQFLNYHIFKQMGQTIFSDLDVQDRMYDFLQPALNAFQQAVTSIPSEWYYSNLEQDICVNYPFNDVGSCIKRISQHTLWKLP